MYPDTPHPTPHRAACRHTRTPPPPPYRQGGFSLPVAILAIVLLSLLGAAMISMLSSSHRSVANAVVSTRAFYAAETGGQYALSKLFPLTGGAPTCAASLTLTLSAPGLTGCTAVVSCNGPVALNGHNFYNLTSTGQCAGGDNKAVRQLKIGARTL